MDEAREDADLALEFQRMAQANSGRGDDYCVHPDSRAGQPPVIVPPEPVPAEQAIRTPTFRENRRRGKHSPRRGKPPDIDAVAEKIERAVRAVKRHREGKP
jgi:hypothetical protein